jgi:hypothetical protein
MAQDDGRRQDEIYNQQIISILRIIKARKGEGERCCTSNPPPLPVVDITSTDSRLTDLNTNVPGILQGRDGSFFNGDILDGAENEGGV